MPFLHPLFPYSRSLFRLRLLNTLFSLSSICLFVGAISTFNTTMLRYPDPSPPSSNPSLLTTPDTIDLWPALSLAWSLIWSLARLHAQRRIVTALATPLHVAEGLASLRSIGPAVGVLVGDLVTWIIIVCLVSLAGVYAAPFSTVYVDADGMAPCPHYIPNQEPPILSYYCTNGFRVTANLEFAGLVLALGTVVGHLVCSGIGWLEVRRRMMGVQVAGGSVGGVELGVDVGRGGKRSSSGKEKEGAGDGEGAVERADRQGCCEEC